MGWADCGEFLGRPIGYGVDATCDYPGCEEEIDRGLAHVCGRMHGGDNGCGGYFCHKHLYFGFPNQMCEECLDACEAEEEQIAA